MRLILVRHGETEENIKRTIQGHGHGGLSRYGKKQARELAIKLKDQSFDVIYSSDLQRAVDTALEIHSKHRETSLVFSPELRELKVEIFRGLPSYLFQWGAKLRNYMPISLPGIESSSSAKQRIIPYINSVFKKYPKGNVLFVTHGGPIRIVRSIIEDKSLNSLADEDIPNCSVWEFEINKPFIDT